jgi:adenylate kinase
MLGSELGLPVLALGQMLRANIELGTRIGRRVETFVTRGVPLPVAEMEHIMSELLSEIDYRYGFIGDGVVRTISQARALSRVLKHLRASLRGAIVLRVPMKELVRRLQGRLVCSECAHTYHRVYRPPVVDSRCDFDGATLERRTDDSAQLIASRLRVQARHLADVIQYYDRSGLALPVNGSGTAETVASRVRIAIAQIRLMHAVSHGEGSELTIDTRVARI